MQATVDGRRIGYDDSGGRGTPLVLLHGFPLDRTVWDDVAGALAGTRVVRIDVRGCGESEPSEGPALMEQLAGDVAALLDRLDVERAALVGHSIGGYVMMAFFRMYAERVAGLSLVASHVAADAAGSAAATSSAEQRTLASGRDALARELETGGTMEPAIASYLPRYLAPPRYERQPELVERLRALMARQNPAGCAQLVRGMQARVSGEDLLADVDVPALVIAGAQDYYLTTATLRGLADAMGADYVELDGVGHVPMMEAPAPTGDALAAFAQRVRG
ncbi:MAG TPA: alpha/beta hydrolase [Candidatus Sulfotelmatobacter sp.]|nr:alpha/beta hydrolase [Candidatus Sulfotelmatobacter sp.]